MVAAPTMIGEVPLASHLLALAPFAAAGARHAGVVAATAGLWSFDRALARAGRRDMLASAVALATGAATAYVGFLVHEWGHLAGAVHAGATVTRPTHPSPFLFEFDEAKNTRAQHLWLAAGGYAATAASLALIVASVPKRSLAGKTALALTGAGVAATLLLEVPRTVRAALEHDATAADASR